MSSTNDRTVQSYNAHMQEYIDGTMQQVSGPTKQWIDENLVQLDKTARILELGSGFGRDAAYIESQGFMVERTDATAAFVDLLKSQGHSARVLNVLADSLGEGYGMIFANAVLLHLTREEVSRVVRKVFAALRPAGRFVFSLKQGDGEGWSEEKLNAPRYFCYWQPEAIANVLREAGFVDVRHTVAPHYRPSDHGFILLTAIKGHA